MKNELLKLSIIKAKEKLTNKVNKQICTIERYFLKDKSQLYALNRMANIYQVQQFCQLRKIGILDVDENSIIAFFINSTG